MAINQLKVVLSILREVQEGNIPNAVDYGIENEMYFNIIEAMQDKKLIKGVTFSRSAGKLSIIFMNDCKITIDGMQYLQDNSTLVKTYKGLKEVREWLPF